MEKSNFEKTGLGNPSHVPLSTEHIDTGSEISPSGSLSHIQREIFLSDFVNPIKNVSSCIFISMRCHKLLEELAGFRIKNIFSFLFFVYLLRKLNSRIGVRKIISSSGFIYAPY